MPKTGSYSLADLRSNRFQSPIEFGLDTINEVWQRDVEVHQRIVTSAFADFCDVTDHRQRIYGTSDDVEATDADEYTRASTSKVKTGATCGFPMALQTWALGFTWMFLENNTVSEMAEKLIALKKSHFRRLVRDFKRAIYGPTNYTWYDRFMSPIVNLDVKRFLNADSADIPQGPFGETFNPATHTHYTAEAALTAAGWKASIATVIEHGHGDNVRSYINVNDEATIRAVSGFKPFEDPRLLLLATAAHVPGQRADITKLNDRPIGLFEQAVVWVKPWTVQGYIVTTDIGGEKPVVLRTRKGQAPALRARAIVPDYPLQAEYFESEYGFGVWNRTNGAVHQFTNGAYQSPTIN